MQTVQENKFQPAITLLNMSGDITITWDASNREAILELVRKKMSQGYSFFIITPRVISVLGNKKVKLKDEAQLEKALGVVVPDAQVNALMNELSQVSHPDSASKEDTAPAASEQTAADARKLRLVSNLDDADVEKVVGSGKAELHLVPKGDMKSSRRAQTAEEVVENQSVAIRPISGG